MYEVWDRVTAKLVGEFETREDAEDSVAGPYRDDFLVLEVDDIDAA